MVGKSSLAKGVHCFVSSTVKVIYFTLSMVKSI